jgi:hypothetical protein
MLVEKIHWYTDFSALSIRSQCWNRVFKLMELGLWPYYINITITILDIIHLPVFYLKLSSTLQVCPYLTGNTLRLHYEPNRLMLSIGLWRWYINITITTVDIVHYNIRLTLDSHSVFSCNLLSLELLSVARPRRKTNLIYWAQLSRFHVKTETECSLRNDTGRWIIFRTVGVMFMYNVLHCF